MTLVCITLKHYDWYTIQELYKWDPERSLETDFNLYSNLYLNCYLTVLQTNKFYKSKGDACDWILLSAIEGLLPEVVQYGPPSPFTAPKELRL